ncbi:MAG: D-glycerate dehydrogenase [Bacteriovorax sp.]|nr:D-glycerate dehydrogenase [Bacteriovorax sp.]
MNNTKNNKIFITRKILPEGIELLRAHHYEVDINPLERALTYEELSEHAKGFNALITMLSDRIDEAFIIKNSHLKIVANYAVGFNNIDLASAKKHGIAIANTPDVLTEATAEVALGLMINSARHFNEASQSARLGEWKGWNPTAHLGLALKGKTLGVIGMGRIGHRLAEMASMAFKMPILYTARSPKENNFNARFTQLDELLQQSDFISIHVPLTADTRMLIGRKEFLKMKKEAILINTARGEIIDPEALIQALREKTIYAAGLDVTYPSPLPPTNPLFSLKNAYILPHIGSATFEARREMSLLCAKNVIAALEGRELLSPVY